MRLPFGSVLSTSWLPASLSQALVAAPLLKPSVSTAGWQGDVVLGMVAFWLMLVVKPMATTTMGLMRQFWVRSQDLSAQLPSWSCPVTFTVAVPVLGTFT